MKAKKYWCPKCGGKKFRVETEKYHAVLYDENMQVLKDDYMKPDETDAHWLTCIDCSHQGAKDSFEVDLIGYVILADDDEMKRFAIKTIIEELMPNVAVTEVRCGCDAMALISLERRKKNSDDLPLLAVVTDNFMPFYSNDYNLQPCAKKIQVNVKASKLNIPVIIVSGEKVEDVDDSIIFDIEDKARMKSEIEDIILDAGIL